MKVLITGFDPFGGEKINPAWEAVRALPDNIDGIEVIKLQIPTVFKKSAKKLFENIDSVKPDVVICVGQAGGRYEFCVERVAINLDDGRIPDNEGYQPVDTPVFEDGDTAYFSSLPIKGMVEELKKAFVILDNSIYGVFFLSITCSGIYGTWINPPLILSNLFLFK